jgi:6-phosphogluconolactonase
MSLAIYPDRAALMAGLAAQIAGELAAVLKVQDRATLAVPGGTTPGPIFDQLCLADLPWDRINVMLTDERWVDETSDRSNTALLKQRLLREKAAAATLIPLYAPGDAPEDRLDELTAGVNGVLPLSVVVLGMGADMHTASLFPGADQLDAALAEDAAPLYAMRAPGAPEPRITLSAPALASAAHIHILITGDEKRAAYDTAKSLNDPKAAPVCAVLDQATVHWAE